MSNKISKQELIDKCIKLKLNITNYKNKNKTCLINLITEKQKEILKPTQPTKPTKPTKPIHLKPLIKWSGGKGDEIK